MKTLFFSLITENYFIFSNYQTCHGHGREKESAEKERSWVIVWDMALEQESSPAQTILGGVRI